METRVAGSILVAVVLVGAMAACSTQAASNVDGGGGGADAFLEGAANFEFFELHVYSELGTACPGSCDSETVITRNNVADLLNGTFTCSVSVAPSETAVVVDLATRADVLSTLLDPNLCKQGNGASVEEMVVHLVDGRIIGNAFSFGCPGAAFQELRTATGQLRQKYCAQSADGGSTD